MRSRRSSWSIAAAGASVALLLSGCDLELSAPPEPDFDRIESVWGIEVPPDAEVQGYYSSEVDFHGGRDDVYVLQLPPSNRSGTWDSSTYTAGIPHDGSPTAEEIIESSEAEVSEEILSSLHCSQPLRADQNYLLTCHHSESDDFYLFEQIF